jgi:hypothetical protein
MSHLRAKIVSVIVVAAVAVPAAAHSAREHRAKARAEREIGELTQAIAPIAAAAPGARRVTLNGATMYFDKKTEQGSLDDVMARIAKECASGVENAAFGLPTDADEGQSKALRLERVHTQDAEDGSVRASLCIFAKEGAPDSDEARRVRYTLAHRRDDGSIAVTTVVNASPTPLNELFPAEGDAPGSDLEGVARPESSRRTLTAIVGKNEHAVRVYESPMSVSASVARYDQQMGALGFATTGSLEDARMYRKDGASFVASFRATTEGSTVALIPFGNAPSN